VKRACAAFAAAAAIGSPSVARAAPARAVVAGPEDDAIAARLEKELRAMGFEVSRVDGADGCTHASIVARMDEAGASAAVCSDGGAVGVLTHDAKGARLRDVVVVRGSDAHDRDDAAVRAAEILRASVELPDERFLPPPSPPPAVTTEPAREAVDLRPAPPAPKEPTTFTPTFIGASGVGALIGAGARVVAIGAKIDVPAHRYAALAVRFDWPVSDEQVSVALPTETRDDKVRLKPGVAGLGVDVPLARPKAAVIPRVGAGFGIAWLHVEGVPGVSRFAGTKAPQPPNVATLPSSSETAVSPAMYLDGAASVLVAGPVRLAFDGMVGATASRLVARANGAHVAYWGQPFGALSARAEIQVP
jgi:hypothetical protein